VFAVTAIKRWNVERTVHGPSSVNVLVIVARPNAFTNRTGEPQKGSIMTVEFAKLLDDTTTQTLQELVQINIDSAKGFEEAAGALSDPALKDVCLNLADIRWQNAEELRGFVEWNEEIAPTEGTYLAALHRVWMNVRQSLSSNDAHAILSEAEFGEDQIKAAYKDAIEQATSTAVYPLLARQYLNVCQGHDRIKALRDARA